LITISVEHKKEKLKLENDLEKLKKVSKIDKEELATIDKIFSHVCEGFQDHQSQVSTGRKIQSLSQKLEDITREKDTLKHKIETEFIHKLKDMNAEKDSFKQKLENQFIQKIDDARKENDTLALKQKLENELERDGLLVTKKEFLRVKEILTNVSAMEESGEELDVCNTGNTETVKKTIKLIQEFNDIKKEKVSYTHKLGQQEKELNDIGGVLSYIDMQHESSASTKGNEITGSLILDQAKKLKKEHEDVKRENKELNKHLTEFKREKQKENDSYKQQLGQQEKELNDIGGVLSYIDMQHERSASTKGNEIIGSLILDQAKKLKKEHEDIKNEFEKLNKNLTEFKREKQKEIDSYEQKLGQKEKELNEIGGVLSYIDMQYESSTSTKGNEIIGSLILDQAKKLKKEHEDIKRENKKFNTNLTEFKRGKQKETDSYKQKLGQQEKELNDIGGVLSYIDMQYERSTSTKGNEIAGSLIVDQAKKLKQEHEDIKKENEKLNKNLTEFKRGKQKETDSYKHKLIQQEKELNDIGEVLSYIGMQHASSTSTKGNEIIGSLILDQAKKLKQEHEDIKNENENLSQNLTEFNRGLLIVHEMLSTPNKNGEELNDEDVEINRSQSSVMTLIKKLKQDLEDAKHQNVVLDKDLESLNNNMAILWRDLSDVCDSKNPNSLMFDGLTLDQRNLVKTILNLKVENFKLKAFPEEKDKKAVSSAKNVSGQSNNLISTGAMKGQKSPCLDLNGNASIEILNIIENSLLKKQKGVSNKESDIVHPKCAAKCVQEDLEKSWEMNVSSLERINATKNLIREVIVEDESDCTTKGEQSITESNFTFETSKENETEIYMEEDESIAAEDDASFTASDLHLSFEYMTKRKWNLKKTDEERTFDASFTASELNLSFEMNEVTLKPDSKTDTNSEKINSYEFTESDLDLSFDLKAINKITKLQTEHYLRKSENNASINSEGFQSKTKNSTESEAVESSASPHPKDYCESSKPSSRYSNDRIEYLTKSGKGMKSSVMPVLGIHTPSKSARTLSSKRKGLKGLLGKMGLSESVNAHGYSGNSCHPKNKKTSNKIIAPNSHVDRSNGKYDESRVDSDNQVEYSESVEERERAEELGNAVTGKMTRLKKRNSKSISSGRTKNLNRNTNNNDDSISDESAGSEHQFQTLQELREFYKKNPNNKNQAIKRSVPTKNTKSGTPCKREEIKDDIYKPKQHVQERFKNNNAAGRKSMPGRDYVDADNQNFLGKWLDMWQDGTLSTCSVE